MSVQAYQPRRYDPPEFVAYDLEELEERIGERIGGPQCDRCGNSSYVITRVENGGKGLNKKYGIYAVCSLDPEDEVSVQFGGCDVKYPITLWDEDLVAF